MKPDDLKQIESKTKEVIISIMELADLDEICTQNQEDKFFYLLMKQYRRYQMGVDELSSICKALYETSRFDSSEEITKYLVMGKDLSGKLRANPREAEVILEALLDYSHSLQDKVYNDTYILEKHPELKDLDSEERMLIAEYLDLAKIQSITTVGDFKKLLLAIEKGTGRGIYKIAVIQKLFGGLHKLATIYVDKLDQDEFLQKLSNAAKLASRPTEDNKEHAQNSRTLYEIRNEVKEEYGLIEKRQAQQTYDLVVPYEDLRKFRPVIQKAMAGIMKKADIQHLASKEDFEKYVLAVVDEYLDYEITTNDVVSFLGYLDTPYSDRFRHDSQDELYDVIYGGSDMTWDTKNINTLTLEEILKYAEKLRAKYASN